MSEITLNFQEYQEIRDAMAFARGQLAAAGISDDKCHLFQISTLEEAADSLEVARWRTEDNLDD